MLAKFVASEVGTHEEKDFISTGVACTEPPHHLMFSRSLPFGSDEDWGIEIEYDAQINSGYNKIKRCVVGRDWLGVELSEPIGRQEGYTGFEVELRISEAKWNSLINDLRRVFTGRDEILVIYQRSI